MKRRALRIHHFFVAVASAKKVNFAGMKCCASIVVLILSSGFLLAAAPAKRAATAPEALQTLPGFAVELLHTAEPETEGSWIALGKDGKGRLIIGGQRNHPILRVTLEQGRVARLENLNLPISEPMGFLWAFDSLYVNGFGKDGFGLYRCRDLDGNDQFESIQFLKRFEGSGEHGPHGLALGPDRKIYVINGNHTKLPDGLSPNSPHRNYREDHLLPRQWDGNGHATGILAPGGYVVRTDADGKEWELLLAGFRNAYDIDFNADGELFTFDSDMEWDWGMPWYRPVRVNHCVTGAEFGWRSGTGKWPDYYTDSLPAAVDIGIGSPTGVAFGTGAKFPEKYQKAFYICDWTYGRLIAVHLQPEGASYRGSFEEFVAPKALRSAGPKSPLNLTDVVIGNDGALYFTVGGRGTQAALYRVTYQGAEPAAVVSTSNSKGTKERALRRELEAFHGRQHPMAVRTAWRHLGTTDRWIRYAARIAIESQPLEQWKDRALSESRPNAALTALMALARVGGPELQAPLIESLEKLSWHQLNPAQQLEKLRILQLSFIRQGRPSPAVADRVIRHLDPLYPSSNENLNRELAQLLIYLEAPSVVTKTLALMATAPTQEEQIHYLFHLRTLRSGWSLDQRHQYFSWWSKDRSKLRHPIQLLAWFADAGRPYSDGASFPKFLQNFHKEAIDNLSAEEKIALAPVLASQTQAAAAAPKPAPKMRAFVKEWKLADLEPALNDVSRGRNFESGKVAFQAAQCLACHRFGNEGGSSGPDLTAISSRFTRRDILESILDPSKVVSEQFQNTTFLLKDGEDVTGRVLDETESKLVVQPNPLVPDQVEIKKSNIQSRQPSKLSPMPEGLVNVLTKEEILDLIAYLESVGRPGHTAFRK